MTPTHIFEVVQPRRDYSAQTSSLYTLIKMKDALTESLKSHSSLSSIYIHSFPHKQPVGFKT